MAAQPTGMVAAPLRAAQRKGRLQSYLERIEASFVRTQPLLGVAGRVVRERAAVRNAGWSCPRATYSAAKTVSFASRHAFVLR